MDENIIPSGDDIFLILVAFVYICYNTHSISDQRL